MSINALLPPQLKSPTLLFVIEGGGVFTGVLKVLSFVSQTVELRHAA